MTKFDNIKIRNYAELTNVITQANKSGLIIFSLLIKDMYNGDCLFNVKVIYKDDSEDNKANLAYTDLVQFLFNSGFNASIKHICIFADCYDLFLMNTIGSF